MIRHTVNLPCLANLLDVFGLGFFFGASSEVEMQDVLVRWESLEMDSPVM